MSTSKKVEYKGGSSQYTVPFSFLEKTFVKVVITDNITQTERTLSYNLDYIVEDNQVKIFITTKETDTITIYRETAINRLVQFSDGSVLCENDLTTMQLQLLHVIEERGTFTITSTTQDMKPLQFERIVKVADGVACARGTLLSYTDKGFVLASNQDYTKLKEVVLALSEVNAEGKAKVLSWGQFGTNDYEDGVTCFVGEAGNIIAVPPIASGTFIKSIGVIEGNILMFQPDSISIRLA